MKLQISLVWKNDSRRFFLFNVSQVQLDSLGLPPRYKSHCCTFVVYLAVLIIAAVPRHHYWVGTLILSLLAAYLAVSITRRASPQGGGFWIKGSLIIQSMWCLYQKELDFKFWETTKDKDSNLYCYGFLLDTPAQQTKKSFLMPDTGSGNIVQWTIKTLVNMPNWMREISKDPASRWRAISN